MDARFLKLITDLRVHLKLQPNVLSSYTVLVKPAKKDNVVWIKDHLNEIGHLPAHIEVWLKDNIIYVDIHFEDKDLNKRHIFSKHITSLPKNVSWFDWYYSKSVRFDDGNDLTIYDPKILDKISNRLVHFENSGLANQIRSLL